MNVRQIVASLSFVLIFVTTACSSIANKNTPAYTLLNKDKCNVSGGQRNAKSGPCQKIDIATPNSKTELCVNTGIGWKFRWNKYTLNSYGNFNIQPRPYTTNRAYYCNPRRSLIDAVFQDSEYFIVKNEYALVSYWGYSSGNDNVFFTVKGELCASTPLISIYQFVRRPRSTDLKIIDYANKGRLIDRPFVLPEIPESITYGDFKRVVGTTPDVFFRLTDLIKLQCGFVPKSLQLKGGYLVEPEISSNGRSHKKGPFNVLPIFDGYFQLDTVGISTLDGSSTTFSREQYKADLQRKARRHHCNKIARQQAREHNAAVGIGSLFFRGWVGVLWNFIPTKDARGSPCN